ncbi:hypothetical protein QYF61_008469 [Mycteria americana]|uniref:Zinc finger protein 541 n=1 Tax=Mycteria americana TaxID=33587 RepID=A0AAN7RSF4_MYCAM|nr:hypothetical protein QYF61_008469 [Mycteria americana]
MDQYPFDDENAFHLEMHLPGFSESPGLVCSEALDHDLCLNAKDVMYTGLSGLDAVPGLPAADAGRDALEADLNTLSLYPAKACGSVQLLDVSDSGSSQHEPGLPTPTVPEEAGGGGGRSAGRGRHPLGSPRPSLPGCSRCGKVFGSASALSKHCLTHSQKREHVCAICSKAFKRPDHLNGLSEVAGDDITKDRLSCPKSTASSNVCAVINPGNVFVIAPGENVVTDLTAQGVSEGLAGPSRTFSAAYECLDALSFPVAPFKAEEDAPSESTLGCFEEAFQSGKTQDFHPWENAGELSFPEVQKHGVPQSETRQLFPKSQEPAACPEPLQVQQQLFQVVTESQQVLSHAQALAPSPRVAPEAEHLPANSLQAGFQQPPPSAPHLTEYDPSAYLQKTAPRFQGVSSDGEKQGPQAAPAFPSPVTEYAGLRDSCAPRQLQYAMPGSAVGSRSSGRSNQLENKASAFKKEKSKDRSTAAGGKPPAGAGRSWRLPAVRREKLMFGPSCAAPPSQVAMASFSPAPAAGATRRLTIFNRIQGGNIYSLTHAAKEENSSAGCSKTAAAPTDGGDCQSGVLRKSCGQLFYTENGLESRGCFPGEQWHLPQRKEEQQVCDAGDGNARKLSLEAAGDGNCPPKPEVPLEDGTVAPLVIPVSVPVTAANSQGGNKSHLRENGALTVCLGLFVQVTEKDSPDGKDLKETLHQKKRKRPKSLFIPPPPAPEAQPGVGGCYQSHLRSPVFLVDHLLRDLFQHSPYTPPPMLSPVREGSGLYFSTLCSSSANGDPNQLFSAVLGRMDRDFGFCLMKDNTKISIQPHINVGSRFQAEVPNLRDRSHLEKDEQAASLVWKPWGDIATNPETQDRVTELLNMACSSVMPGGGTNLELALHCLHEARGSVLEALEMLLFGAPQKSESHPLANYRYAGSDTWTPLEKQLFKKAFCVHKKDFYLIQKKIQTKNVSQCVEYYYIWKKKIKFDYSRAQVIEKKVKRDKDEVEETEDKAVCSPKKRHRLLPKDGMKIKQRSYRKTPRSTGSPSCGPRESPYQAGAAEGRGVFPCRECER